MSFLEPIHGYLPEPPDQILIALEALETSHRSTDLKSIEQERNHYFCGHRSAWSGALASLLTRGLVEQKGDAYTLTDASRPLAESLRQTFPKHIYFYDEYFARARESQAHARFCERVYGRNLCQHGMMDMTQLHLMLEHLALSSQHEVLDLGCGNGMISEYISDATGSHVTGIDTSRVGIAEAIERTCRKTYRLTFLLGDMLRVPLARAKFDVVIAIDTIYFVRELPRLVDRVLDAAKPGGIFMVFFSSSIGPDKPLDLLQPDRTAFGAELQRRGLSYSTWDLTEQEMEHWRVKRAAALEFEKSFEREGNAFLFERRFLEADTHQQYVESKRLSRYLYRVKL